MRLALLCVPAILLIAALAGCSDENDSKAGTCADVAADVKTIEVHVGTHADGKMYLTATPGLTATQGEKVRFKVTNDDKTTLHDVALKNYEGQNYEHELDGGATVCTLHAGQPYFTAATKGNFEIYCEIAGHKAAGMMGTFVVT